MVLHDAASIRRIERVLSFVGEDASGSFGILPDHRYFMTCLELGLARFRCVEGGWQYLALTGGVLIFRENRLQLCTRRYVMDTDYERITEALTRHLLAEEDALQGMRASLAQLEHELMRRLWR
jgi:F-type H+-transporting ATPase subunit epsilon